MDNDILCFKTKKGAYFLNRSEIVLCEAEGRYTKIKTVSKTILVSKNLKLVEKIIADNNFYRIHHCYLINIKFVTEYSSSTNTLILNNCNIKIAVRKRKDFFTKLMKQ